MFQVHNIANEAAFSQVLWRDSTSVQNACNILKDNGVGQLRASEWNHDTKLMTIWHQGKHICLLKRPPVEKDDAMKMVTMLKNVMQLHLHAMKTQIMDLGSEYHLALGENRLAHLFVNICIKNKSIYEQALWEVTQETVGRDWSSVNAVVKLKRGQDSVDKYHILRSKIKSGMAIQLLL